jgi:hypothetical protein
LTDDPSAKLNEPVREPHRHPGWHHRNARLVCFGTGGWLRSESVAGFVGIRSIALGRKSWLFAGSDRGGQRAAAMYSLIVTAKLNDVDPQAWLADVLGRIAEHPASKLDELLPWNWQARQARRDKAA